MASGDLSTDVSVGLLTPAPSVRPVGSNSPHEEPQPKPRSQARDEDASEETPSESDATSEHQLDRLA
jgi:hypothetical protein